MQRIKLSVATQREDFRNRIENVSLAEVNYAVLMGLDSVNLKSDVELGGIDQLLNFGQCRLVQEIYQQKPEIAFGTPILEGLSGDGRKMSKSLGNCIYLSDEPDVIKQKVFSMYTDPNHIKVEDPGQVEGNTVFTYLDVFSKPEDFVKFLPEYKNLEELKAHYTRGGLGDVKIKKFLNAILQELIAPIRERRKELEKNPDAIFDILRKGTEKARTIAKENLIKLRKQIFNNTKKMFLYIAIIRKEGTADAMGTSRTKRI